MVLFLAVIGLFVLLGAILYSGRGAAMIAGYNTMPAAEKAKYDEPALARFVGRMMFALAFSMVFWVLADVLATGWLFGVGIALFIGILVFSLAYANTGNRFRKP